MMVYGAPMLADQTVEFTLGPAYIDIDPDKQELTDYAKRILEFDEYPISKNVTLLTNVANTEIEIPAGAKWISQRWQKDEATVTFNPQTLPDDLDRRETIVRIIGRDSTGTKILAQDSIIIRQVRPYITIPSPVEFEVKGGTKMVELETSLDNLIAEVVKEANPDNFCSIELTKGEGCKWTISITAKENKGEEDREASILVKGTSVSGQNAQIVFYVRQKGTGEEEEPGLPTTDELPGSPYPNINYVSCSVSLTRPGAVCQLDLQNDYFSNVDGDAQASIDGRYIYVLSTSGSIETGNYMRIYLKIDNESIDKNIVGGRIFMQDENANFGETVSMTLGKVPNWFHNRRHIEYSVEARDDYYEYDPDGYFGMRWGPMTGAGLSKFVEEMTASSWFKDSKGTDHREAYSLSDDVLDWGISIDVKQFKDMGDNEYDNDYQDAEFVAKFPSQSLYSELEQKGMTIHRGSTPPAVDGAFVITPTTAIGQKGYDRAVERGHLDDYLYVAEYIKLSGLSGDRIMFDSGALYANAFHNEPFSVAIQGSDNKFTISYLQKNWNSWRMAVYSAEVDGTSLKNVQGAMILVDDDLNANTFIIYKDTDGVSESIDWTAYDWIKLMRDDDDWDARYRTRSIRKTSDNLNSFKQRPTLSRQHK